MNNKTIPVKNTRILAMLSAATLLLLAPLVAMQLTSEVQWTLSDFAVAGVLLYSTAFLCELVLRNVKSAGYRLALCAGVLALVLLVWAELAVGLFGTPLAGS